MMIPCCGINGFAASRLFKMVYLVLWTIVCVSNKYSKILRAFV